MCGSDFDLQVYKNAHRTFITLFGVTRRRGHVSGQTVIWMRRIIDWTDAIILIVWIYFDVFLGNIFQLFTEFEEKQRGENSLVTVHRRLFWFCSPFWFRQNMFSLKFFRFLPCDFTVMWSHHLRRRGRTHMTMILCGHMSPRFPMMWSFAFTLLPQNGERSRIDENIWSLSSRCFNQRTRKKLPHFKIKADFSLIDSQRSRRTAGDSCQLLLLTSGATGSSSCCGTTAARRRCRSQTSWRPRQGPPASPTQAGRAPP